MLRTISLKSLCEHGNVYGLLLDNTDCHVNSLSRYVRHMSRATSFIPFISFYVGIHRAAKKLEKKGKAKETRQIALLLTQRLGTQVLVMITILIPILLICILRSELVL
jgi:hypothetical protein